MLCDRCGSIDIVRARARVLDKVIRLFTGKKPFVCRRCGWRARRAWSEADRQDRSKFAPSDQSDPALAVLDED